jgi:hypothetical protein
MRTSHGISAMEAGSFNYEDFRSNFVNKMVPFSSRDRSTDRREKGHLRKRHFSPLNQGQKVYYALFAQSKNAYDD